MMNHENEVLWIRDAVLMMYNFIELINKLKLTDYSWCFLSGNWRRREDYRIRLTKQLLQKPV